MTDEIIDISAAIKSGRYPYDFVQALTGPGSMQHSHRLKMLDAILATPNGPEALHNLLVAGARHFLDALFASYADKGHNPEVVQRAVTKLAAASGNDLLLDDCSASPEGISW